VESELPGIVGELEGPILVIGAAIRVGQLLQVRQDLFLLDAHTKPSKVARQSAGRRLFCADPIFPPLAGEGMGAVVVAGELGRQADGARAVGAWLGLLRPGGMLYVIEPEVDTPVVGSLVRLVTGAPAHRPPEVVAALFLNAGLARVGQLQAEPRGGVLTSGMKRVHAVACSR